MIFHARLEQLRNDPHFSLFHDVAHEIAHFWWPFGAGQGDWINEALAEHFSALAVQKIMSDQQFQNLLANYRKEAGNLPAVALPLAEVPFSGDVFVIQYYKGSLMLDSLRGSPGRSEILRRFAGVFSADIKSSPSEQENFAFFGRKSWVAGRLQWIPGSIHAAVCLRSETPTVLRCRDEALTLALRRWLEAGETSAGPRNAGMKASVTSVLWVVVHSPQCHNSCLSRRARLALVFHQSRVTSHVL